MVRLKGKTQLTIPLKKRAKADGIILTGLIILLLYKNIEQFSLLSFYLFITLSLLCLYATFWRSPVLLLKGNGFFYGNVYWLYEKTYAVNLAENQVICIDMKSGRRFIIQPKNEADLNKIMAFFKGHHKEK